MVVKFQVFKKSSPNGKITIYLPKRQFVEKSSHVEPIEGVLVVDPNYVGVRKVFVQLLMTFRYGAQDEEVMALSLKRSLYIDTHQVYPPHDNINASDIQMNLANKLGNFAYPFILDLPRLGSPSYTMQRGWKQDGAGMGMAYDVMAFVGHNDTEIKTRSSCKLVVRKVQEIPASLSEGKKPHETVTKTLLTSIGTVTIDCTLDRRVFEPEETIPVLVSIQNNTQREVKRIKIKLVQILESPFFNPIQVRARTIKKLDEKIHLRPGGTTSKNVSLIASAPPDPEIGDILLHTQFDTNAKDTLACSTIFTKDTTKEDIFGIVVSYAVRVKATFGSLQGDVILDVPFTLKVPN